MDFTNVQQSHAIAKCISLSSTLLNRYKTWVENGKPEMSADDLDKIKNEGQQKLDFIMLYYNFAE